MFTMMGATEEGHVSVRNDFSAVALFPIMWMFVGYIFAINLFVGVVVALARDLVLFASSQGLCNGMVGPGLGEAPLTERPEDGVAIVRLQGRLVTAPLLPCGGDDGCRIPLPLFVALCLDLLDAAGESASVTTAAASQPWVATGDGWIQPGIA